MIKLRQPSLALHSCDVPGYRYSMWQSWVMPERATAMDVLNWIRYARDTSPELSLRNVVINCHGNDGKLSVGGDGQPTINKDNIGIFTKLRGTDLGTIWLVACAVASSANGKLFCQRLAQFAGCSVVAADENQIGALWCPWGSVDNFEGHTFEWDAAGWRRPCPEGGSGVPGVDDD
jgi:hypothetical protein